MDCKEKFPMRLSFLIEDYLRTREADRSLIGIDEWKKQMDKASKNLDNYNKIKCTMTESEEL